MEKKKAIAIVVLILGVIGFVLYYRWVNSPRYALMKVKEAVEKHDLKLFREYVDVESLTWSLVDQTVKYAVEKEMSKEVEDEWEKLGRDLAVGLANLLKPVFYGLVKVGIENFIAGGKFEVVGDGSREGEVFRKNFEGKFGDGKLSFTGIEYEREFGDVAFVGLGFLHKDYNEKFVLEVKLRMGNDGWKIVELGNLYDFMKRLDEIERRKVEELNRRISERISRNLVVESVGKYSYARDVWGIDRRVGFKVNFKNVGDRVIDECRAVVSVKNSGGRLLKKFEVVLGDDIAPGRVLGVVKEFDVNLFIKEENELYETPAGNLYVDVLIPFVKFKDGEVLKLKEVD
jgi:hypothetical protein